MLRPASGRGSSHLTTGPEGMQLEDSWGPGGYELKGGQQPGGPSFGEGITEQDDSIVPQAMEILSSLASLGISQQLRTRVQDALVQLDRAALTAVQHLAAGGSVPCGIWVSSMWNMP